MGAPRRINAGDQLHGCNSVTFRGRAGSSLTFPTVGYCTGALFHAIASPVGSNLNRWRSTSRTTSAAMLISKSEFRRDGSHSLSSIWANLNPLPGRC